VGIVFTIGNDVGNDVEIGVGKRMLNIPSTKPN